MEVELSASGSDAILDSVAGEDSQTAGTSKHSCVEGDRGGRVLCSQAMP